MHRTGTSLITRDLQVLGVDLGEKLLPAMADVNAKGFWEDADVNALNIAMLHAISSEWDYLAPVSEAQFQQLELDGYFLQAVELLRNKLARSAVFGLKDPRIAKLLPFWARVFAHCEFDVSYLLTLRHPLSVAKSLRKRDGFSHEKSYLLWFVHVVFAARFAVHQKVSLVDYDVFMAHPERELTRLAGEFVLPVDGQEMAVFLREFVDHGLRHTHYALDDLLLDPACPAVVREVYAHLLALAAPGGSGDLRQVEDSIASWSDKLGFGAVPFAVIDALSEERRNATQQLAAQDQALQSSRGLVTVLESFNQTRAAQVHELYAASLERDRHIAKLGGQLGAANAELEHLLAAFGRREDRIEELARQIEAANDERRIQVAQLQRQLAEAGMVRSQLARVLHERDAKLDAQQLQLRSGAAEIGQLTTTVQ